MLTIFLPHQRTIPHPVARTEVFFILAQSTGPMDTKLDRMVAYDMEPPLKIISALVKNYFHSHIFFEPQKCTFNLTIGSLYD